jgi:LacI family transcriptional regulator
MGHRDIVMVNGNVNRLYQARERHAGAVKAMTGAGHRADALGVVEVPAFTVAAGLAAGEQILARKPRPTALFCANDLLALGVLQSMVRAGVRVPEEVAIVGYDDIDFAAAAAVPLSSVRQPRQLIGRTAAELVIAEVQEHEAHEHQHVVFTPELVVRASSDFRRSSKVRHRMTKSSQGR